MDGRDQKAGVMVYLLVLVLFGVYFCYATYELFDKRNHPPVSVNVVSTMYQPTATGPLYLWVSQKHLL